MDDPHQQPYPFYFAAGVLAVPNRDPTVNEYVGVQSERMYSARFARGARESERSGE